jgi:hypothetical protein
VARTAETASNRVVQAIADLSSELVQTRAKLSANTHIVFRDRVGWWHMLPLSDIGYRLTDTRLLFVVVGGRDHAELDTGYPTSYCMPSDFEIAVRRCVETRDAHLAGLAAEKRNRLAAIGRTKMGVTYQEYARMTPADQERIVDAGRSAIEEKLCAPAPKESLR